MFRQEAMEALQRAKLEEEQHKLRERKVETKDMYKFKISICKIKYVVTFFLIDVFFCSMVFIYCFWRLIETMEAEAEAVKAAAVAGKNNIFSLFNLLSWDKFLSCW